MPVDAGIPASAGGRAVTLCAEALLELYWSGSRFLSVLLKTQVDLAPSLCEVHPEPCGAILRAHVEPAPELMWSLPRAHAESPPSSCGASSEPV